MPKARKKSPKSALARERTRERRELERADIPPELRAFAPRVRRRKGMSLAESVAHYAHENAAELAAEEAERAERIAARMQREHDTPKTRVEKFSRKGREMVRITSYRPITPASKHWEQEEIPF